MTTTNRENREQTPTQRFANLQQLHDELVLKTHLMKMDGMDLWSQLEQKWKTLSSDLRRAHQAASESSEDISAATNLLFEEIEQGYRRLRATLKH